MLFRRFFPSYNSSSRINLTGYPPGLAFFCSTLGGSHGVPRVHYKGRQGDYYVMVRNTLWFLRFCLNLVFCFLHASELCAFSEILLSWMCAGYGHAWT